MLLIEVALPLRVCGNNVHIAALLFEEFRQLLCSLHTPATQWAAADLQLILQLPAQTSNLKDQPLILHLKTPRLNIFAYHFLEHATVF